MPVHRRYFEFDEVGTLSDLTNPYFEGTATANAHAAFGRSKEKRSRASLGDRSAGARRQWVSPKRSAVFAGTAREAKTLAQRVGGLSDHPASHPPTGVLDAGFAIEENSTWLGDHPDRYRVVSRERHRAFNAEEAVTVKDESELGVRVQRVVNADTGEGHLYGHSAQREQKEQNLEALFSERFEAELQKLASGLHKKGTVKRSDKVLERLGRVKQKYARAAQYDDVSVEHDEAREPATALQWARNQTLDDTLGGGLLAHPSRRLG